MPASEKPRILCMDREESLLKVLEALMSAEFDAEVLTATRGIDGVELCVKNKPDLIIFDKLLDDSNGLAVVKALRKRLPHIPAILATTHWISGGILEQAGVGDYLVKPCQMQILVESVRTALREGGDWRSKYVRAKIAGLSKEYLASILHEYNGDVKKAMESSGRSSEFLTDYLEVGHPVFPSQSFHFAHAVLPVLFNAQGNGLIDQLSKDGCAPLAEKWNFIARTLRKEGPLSAEDMSVEIVRLGDRTRAAVVKLPPDNSLAALFSSVAVGMVSVEPGTEDAGEKRFFTIERWCGQETPLTFWEVGLDANYFGEDRSPVSQKNLTLPEAMKEAIAHFDKPKPQTPLDRPPYTPILIGQMVAVLEKRGKEVREAEKVSPPKGEGVSS